MSQLGFDLSPRPTQRARSHAERFEEFHRANPHVYRRLVELARAANARGQHLGVGMLYEVVRYERATQTSSADGWKLNNNHRPFYSRLIMAQEPDLAGYFDKRPSAADEAEAENVA